MAINYDLFVQPTGMGLVENVRNAQRQDPSSPYAYNSPTSAAAIPGAYMKTGDFQEPVYCIENFGGTMGVLTKAVPFTSINAATVITGTVQSAWASGNVGAGINTNYSDASLRTRHYVLGWQASRMQLVQGVNETQQPSGRLMEQGWDPTNPETVVLTQQSAVQKLTLTVAAATPPTVEGVGTWYITVWLLLTLPDDTAKRRSTMAYYIGLVPSSGGTVVDGYDIDVLKDRGAYDPSTLLNMPSTRACCRLGNQFVGAGGGVSQQNFIWNSTGLKSVNDTVPRVRSGASDNILRLVRDSGTNIPYDPRVCNVTGCAVSGGGATVTITVENYHYFEVGDSVFVDNVGGVTGLNALSWTVATTPSDTVFTITPGGTPFGGAYTSGGQVAKTAFQWPGWVVGQQIMVGDQGKYATIEKIVNSSGTNDGVQIDSNVYSTISSNKDFTVSGKNVVFIGHPDPRLLDKAPAGLRVDMNGFLPDPIEAVIASTDTNGVYVFSKTTGRFIYNIPMELAITGIAGGAESGSQTPMISEKPLTFGTSGPGALAYVGDGGIIGYSPELGPWIMYGSSQELLDPEQRLGPFYRSFRFGQDGETDVTPFITVAFNQNLNFAVFCIPGFSQLLWYDFRTKILNICPVYGQQPMCVATVKQYSSKAYVNDGSGYTADDEIYAPDRLANAGDVTLVTLQTGDILEFNPSFYTDYAAYWGTDTANDNYRGQVQTVGADTVDMTSDSDFCQPVQYGLSPSGGASMAAIVDTTVEDVLDGAVVGVVLSGSDRYATVQVDAAHGLSIGSYVTLTGVLGVTPLNATWVVSAVPGSDQFTLDGGSASYFSGAYTSGGVAAYQTFASRLGSYRPVAAFDAAGMDFLSSTAWSGGAPRVGDIVQINPIYCRVETREFEAGFQTTVQAVESFMLADESGQGYAVRFRVIPSGQSMEPSESAAVNTAYPSFVTNLGRTYDLIRSEGGRAVRLRIEWLAPDGGTCKLGSFDVRIGGDKGESMAKVKQFPPEVQRGDKADFDMTGDLSMIRGVGMSNVSPRPGTRLLTIFYETRPVNISGTQTTQVKDSVVFVKRVGGQAFMCVSTRSPRIADGFLFGTITMTPLLSIGSFAEAVPEVFPY